MFIKRILPFGASVTGQPDYLEPYLVPTEYVNDLLVPVHRHKLSFQETASETCGYIFYQPGDVHLPLSLAREFSRLILRIGDLHHLCNPLLSTIGFLSNLTSINFSLNLNTNPNLIKFFSYLFGFAQAVPISELTIARDLRYQASKLLVDEQYDHENILVYFGSLESPFHPRRSFLINSLTRQFSSREIHLIPSCLPSDWLAMLRRYPAVIAPSLNGQWSHNVFIPNLVGTRILTDLQAHPSYPYYSSMLVTASAINYSHSLADLRAVCLRQIHRPLPTFQERLSIAGSALAAMHTADTTASIIYAQDDSSTWCCSEGLPSISGLAMVSANIYEILQETVRVLVSYDRIVVHVTIRSLFCFVTKYLHHPRIFYVYAEEQGCPGANVIIAKNYSSHGLFDSSLLFVICVDEYVFAGSADCLGFSTDCFDPLKIHSIGECLALMKDVINAAYSPRIFPQQLLNGVTILY